MSFVALMRDGGPGSYLVLLIGGAALTLAVAAVILSLSAPQIGKWMASGALLGVASLQLAGLGARALGIVRVQHALLDVDPEFHDRLLYQGYNRAGAFVALALVLAALPTVIGLAALALSWRKPSGRGAPGLICGGVAAAALAISAGVFMAPLPGHEFILTKGAPP